MNSLVNFNQCCGISSHQWLISFRCYAIDPISLVTEGMMVYVSNIILVNLMCTDQYYWNFQVIVHSNWLKFHKAVLKLLKQQAEAKLCWTLYCRVIMVIQAKNEQLLWLWKYLFQPLRQSVRKSKWPKFQKIDFHLTPHGESCWVGMSLYFMVYWYASMRWL